MVTNEIAKMFFSTVAAFVVAMASAPGYLRFLRRSNLGKQNRDATSAPVFAELHQSKVGTPNMGGVIIWGAVAVLIVVFALLNIIFGIPLFAKLDFLSRKETWLPFCALIAAALVGLIDDYYNVKKIGTHAGLRMRHRLFLYSVIAAVGAYWFYIKLGWDILRVPFLGSFNIGFWYIPLFILVIVATSFSINGTDGLDGLAGGTMLFAFATYAAIAFLQGKYNLAAFCAAIVGALFAFLWLNIYPAKFFMGDTGAMSLGVTLGIVAMLTNTALFLPIIAIVPVLESLSVIIQYLSKKFRHGKKIFKSSPLHHHLEAIGWQEPTIVMRSWIISAVFSAIGLVLYIMDSQLTQKF